uniref:Uncharacterized protein n=1 Tax=Lactuca sativa TaxID=4236 RepID=A0A9R1WE36_LACSA|nr:hypothetical protein LSAT_V11C200055300 [Lactuca sativa]
MHYTSFKDDDKENVKKLKRQKNKEGNVVKARKMPRVVGNDAEEAMRIQVRTSPNVLYSCMHNLSKEQEVYISSIGLRHLLNMKVDGCASIMGHYTVSNFDAYRMVLKLHHGQSISMGTCDLSMLSKVTKDLDLSDIDWCGYVFDCLKETKSAWNPNNKKGFYVGPIILMLVRVGNDARGVKSTDGRCKEMYDMLVQQKKVLEDKINDAVKKYPKNQLVKEWKNKVNDMFNEVSASEEPVQSQWWYDNEAEIERTLILATSHK